MIFTAKHNTKFLVNKRILAIDYLRAIAIILVVIGHWDFDGAPVWWINVIKVIYTFHMPLFMAISGYTYMVSKKAKSYTSFIIGKIKRLMVPYFFTSAIIVLLKLLMQRYMYVQNPIKWDSIEKIFYLPEAGYFLWFIWALWWIFVIIPFFKTRKNRSILFVISLFCSFIPCHLTEIFCIQQTKQFMVFFLVGVLFYDWKEYIKLRTQMQPIIFVTCIYLILEIMYIYGYTWTGYIIPYIAIYAFFLVAMNTENCIPKKISDFLLKISSASYIIYLFHTTFEGLVKSILIKFSSSIVADYYIILTIIAIVIGLMAPMLLYKYIFSEFKITRFMFGLKG